MALGFFIFHFCLFFAVWILSINSPGQLGCLGSEASRNRKWPRKAWKSFSVFSEERLFSKCPPTIKLTADEPRASGGPSICPCSSWQPASKASRGARRTHSCQMLTVQCAAHKMYNGYFYDGCILTNTAKAEGTETLRNVPLNAFDMSPCTVRYLNFFSKYIPVIHEVFSFRHIFFSFPGEHLFLGP